MSLLRSSWNHLPLEERERLQRKLDSGKYLTKHAGLSEKFSKTAKTRVEIYFDRAVKKYVLHYKGKFCMWLPHGDSPREHKRVYEHFARICRSSIRYDDVKKKILDSEKYLEKEHEDLLNEVSDDFAKDIYDYAAKGKCSVVINGGN